MLKAVYLTRKALDCRKDPLSDQQNAGHWEDECLISNTQNCARRTSALSGQFWYQEWATLPRPNAGISCPGSVSEDTWKLLWHCPEQSCSELEVWLICLQKSLQTSYIVWFFIDFKCHSKYADLSYLSSMHCFAFHF